MNVILKQDVNNVGIEGQIVRVASGFYRNFLKPRNLAVEADKANVKWVEAQKAKANKRMMEEQEKAKAFAAELSKLQLSFQLKAGENDKLFGSVTSTDIADKLKEQNIDIDRRKIVLAESIKQLGLHTVTIKVFHEIEAHVKILVEKEEE